MSVIGSYWDDNIGQTCEDFCESQGGQCGGATEYDNDHCGSNYIRDLSCSTVIEDAGVNHLWHVVCSCQPSDDNSDGPGYDECLARHAYDPSDSTCCEGVDVGCRRLLSSAEDGHERGLGHCCDRANFCA